MSHYGPATSGSRNHYDSSGRRRDHSNSYGDDFRGRGRNSGEGRYGGDKNFEHHNKRYNNNHNRQQQSMDPKVRQMHEDASNAMVQNLTVTVGCAIARDPTDIILKQNGRLPTVINGYALLPDDDDKPSPEVVQCRPVPSKHDQRRRRRGGDSQPPSTTMIQQHPSQTTMVQGRGRGTTLPAWMTNKSGIHELGTTMQKQNHQCSKTSNSHYETSRKYDDAHRSHHRRLRHDDSKEQEKRNRKHHRSRTTDDDERRHRKYSSRKQHRRKRRRRSESISRSESFHVSSSSCSTTRHDRDISINSNNSNRSHRRRKRHRREDNKRSGRGKHSHRRHKPIHR